MNIIYITTNPINPQITIEDHESVSVQLDVFLSPSAVSDTE